MVRGVSLGAEALDPLAESVVVVFVLEVQVQGVSLVGELLGLVGQVIVRWAAPASGPVVVDQIRTFCPGWDRRGAPRRPSVLGWIEGMSLGLFARVVSRVPVR